MAIATSGGVAECLVIGTVAAAAAEDRAAGMIVMLPRIVDARYVSNFTVWLRFSDGVEGEVDLSRYLDGPMFEELRDPDEFRRFSFHTELRTIVWPYGADLAPEFLRSKLRVVA